MWLIGCHWEQCAYLARELNFKSHVKKAVHDLVLSVSGRCRHECSATTKQTHRHHRNPHTHTPMHPHTQKALHKVTNSSIKGDRPPRVRCLSPLTSPWQKNDNRSYRWSSGGKSQCKGSIFFFWGESTHWAGAHISKPCRNLVRLRLQINALLKNSLRLERCDISVIKYLCMCLHVLMTLRTCAAYTTALYHF